MIVNHAVRRDDYPVAALFHAFYVVWQFRVDALPQTTNVLSTCRERFCASTQDRVRKNGVATSGRKGLGDVGGL